MFNKDDIISFVDRKSSSTLVQGEQKKNPKSVFPDQINIE